MGSCRLGLMLCGEVSGSKSGKQTVEVPTLFVLIDAKSRSFHFTSFSVRMAALSGANAKNPLRAGAYPR